MTGALWFVTDGFTDGSFSSLGISVIVTNALVGMLLGLLDVSLLVDERLQSLYGNHPYTRLVIGGLLGLIAAIVYTFLDVQPVEALVVIVSFFAAEFAGRAYHVFVR